MKVRKSHEHRTLLSEYSIFSYGLEVIGQKALESKASCDCSLIAPFGKTKAKRGDTNPPERKGLC